MIDFNQYLDRQSSEDTRSFIIHYPAKSGKTAFAMRAAAQRLGIYYFDLQQAFLENADIPPIQKCDINFLKNFLKSLQVSEEFVIIDNADFLLNTWESADKLALIQWIKVQLRSPGVTDKTFIFMIQTDDILSSARFNNTYGQPRVLRLNDFSAL